MLRLVAGLPRRRILRQAEQEAVERDVHRIQGLGAQVAEVRDSSSGLAAEPVSGSARAAAAARAAREWVNFTAGSCNCVSLPSIRTGPAGGAVLSAS